MLITCNIQLLRTLSWRPGLLKSLPLYPHHQRQQLDVLLNNTTLSYRSDAKDRKNDRVVALPAVEQHLLEWVLREHVSAMQLNSQDAP
ncbi:hypothetical protein H257_14306 [Aphanomyces astaci]|uniref:Uncharacterized protein n=1 Tax=Aphanomyces astaci TaxID=112090 RepID=W4FTJ0_APHAT|nr:hypothetical protein H257_14306 [Aphanomyces astaci]ETV70144.1 hypothetical protein H257_14306 [Aphanomyces astaci]|eukprot:XP_009840375.1 hypothetical protein H257_14306 [Aphanomyces astaci]